jgi:hypothetical protein
MQSRSRKQPYPAPHHLIKGEAAPRAVRLTNNSGCWYGIGVTTVLTRTLIGPDHGGLHFHPD